MTKSFSLEPRGPTRLQIVSTGIPPIWEVHFDGARVATLGDAAAIRRGETVRLPDGSELFVRSMTSYFSPGLCVLRDGRPVPGSDFDPRRIGRQTAILVGILGLMAAGTTVATTLGYFATEPLTQWRIALLAGVLLALIVPILRGSRAAVLAAAVAYVANDAIGICEDARAGVPLRAGAIVFHLLITVWIVRGLRRAPARGAATDT